MAEPDLIPPRAGLRRSLVLKLILIIGVPVALFSAASIYFFTDWGRREFLSDTKRIGEEGASEMRANTEEVLDTSHALVTGVVKKITATNRQALAELPFELWGIEGETEEDIKKEIRRHGEGLEKRSLQAASTINKVFRRRAERRLEERTRAMQDRQESASALFARRLQGHTVLFLGASILLLGVALWGGLWLTVLRPVRRLHEGVERMSRGEWSYRLETASGDELGDLARSFNRMGNALSRSLGEVAEKQDALEVANREIREWNRTLEERVRAKTAELESSLSELRRTQRELIHAAKMAGIGTLAGGIAHEFNNMLGGIRGCAEDALEEEDPKGVQEALGVILRTAERACSVVENLLEFSRKTPFRPVETDLAGLVEDTLRLLDTEFGRAGVTVRKDVEGPCPVLVDPSQMQQVLLNLFTNALHAVEDAGEKVVRVRLRRAEGGTDIDVDDAGPGLSPEERERAFEPFYTTKTGAGPRGRFGTGLGLSVSFGILEAHGGSITAGESDLGGARFHVRLPDRPAQPGDSS